MKCPRCGHEITKRRKRCEVCGQDISIYERLYRISNSFYNRGLEKARVRDLTGAIGMLKKSLEINKENTDARNLLGLVYFEMGEVVAALGEWVISKHLNPDDVDSERLIDKVQSDTVAFDLMNQTIKKYNVALTNAQRQDDDLAILQLKRVISMNPKYIRAMLLLSLVYLKTCEFEKARRCLTRVLKIDVGNTTALRYMEEVRLHTQPGTVAENDKDIDDLSSTPQFVPVHSYREERPNFIAFLTFFLGIVIGVVVIYYMAVPNIRQGIVDKYNEKEKDYSAILSAKDITISSLESNVRILETEIEELERALKSEEGYVVTDYEPLINLLYDTQAFLKSVSELGDNTLVLPIGMQVTAEELINRIDTMDMSAISNTSAIALYEELRDPVGYYASQTYISQGIHLYSGGKSEEALEMLQKAYTYYTDDPELLYHLGRCHHASGDLQKAKAFYREVIKKHPTSIRYQEAEVYLNYIVEQEQSQN